MRKIFSNFVCFLESPNFTFDYIQSKYLFNLPVALAVLTRTCQPSQLLLHQWLQPCIQHCELHLGISFRKWPNFDFKNLSNLWHYLLTSKQLKSFFDHTVSKLSAGSVSLLNTVKQASRPQVIHKTQPPICLDYRARNRPQIPSLFS